MQIKIPKTRRIALTETTLEMMGGSIVIRTTQTVISLGKRLICIVLRQLTRERAKERVKTTMLRLRIFKIINYISHQMV
ncbi:hypothetical protein Egran_00070, partial [Elaphomyces granulatus]